LFCLDGGLPRSLAATQEDFFHCKPREILDDAFWVAHTSLPSSDTPS
jgi:hypothetical protein